MRGRWLILPREHGAWGMLLQPFVAAAILAREWDWLYLPAALLVLVAFVLREPLIILARQKWTWREWKPESAAAIRCLMWQLPLSAVLFLVLLNFLPAASLVSLAAVAALLTLLSVWMTLRNCQRSIGLQVISSVGLGTTTLLAALVGVKDLPPWSWLLWGLLSLHGIASILVVRTRLELRASSRPQSSALWRGAWTLQFVQACAAILLVAAGSAAFAAPIAFSTAVCVFELFRLGSGTGLKEPLTRVGFRTLGTSVTHSAIAVAALW